MTNNVPHSRGIGASFLVAGLLLLAAFFVVPSSIMGMIEQLWGQQGYTGMGASSLILVLATALSSCYLGIRYLLGMPPPSLIHSIQVGINVILSFLAQFSFLWFYLDIRSTSLSLSWIGFVLGIVTDFVILLIGCVALYSLVTSMENLDLDEELEFIEEETPIERDKYNLTAIESQIYERYCSQVHQPWEFKPVAPTDVELFHPVPYLPGEDDWFVLRSPWRVVLELFRSGYAGSLTIGLDIYGDIVLGRDRNEEAGRIVLDLSPYHVRKLGASRHHMLLRPTSEAIYMIDLGSRHGTILDDDPIEPYKAVKLEGDSRFSLGRRVIFHLHVIKRPGEMLRRGKSL